MLVLTLIVIAVLAVVAVAFMQNTTSERFTARSHSNFSRAQLAAKAGLGAASENLVRGTTNDSFIVVLNQTNRQLFVGQWQAGDTNSYTALFSASTNVTNAAIATNRVPTTSVSGGTNFIVTLPGSLSVTSPVVSWVYLTNSLGQTNARFAYWVEDLSGKLDLSVVGAIGTNARRPTGTNPQEIALWSLLNPSADADANNADVAALVGARSNLFTPATARIVSTNVTSNILADLAAGLRHDTNEPQVIPFGFGYAQQGQAKLNLNANLTAAGATNITNAIRVNLPLFASTNRSGNMNSNNYVNYLAGNIVDYADADFVPTEVGTGIQAETGNEPCPWLTDMYDLVQWQGWGGNPAVQLIGSTYYANFTVTTYAEFWNMTDQDATGDLKIVQNQTTLPVSINGSTPYIASSAWTNTTTITIRANEYKILSFVQNLTLPWGPTPPPTLATITPQNGTTSYELFWNTKSIDKSPGAGLKRSQTTSVWKTGPNTNYWNGTAMVIPVFLTNGLVGDPRINKSITNNGLYIGHTYSNYSSWGGRNFLPNWPAGTPDHNRDEVKNWSDGNRVTASLRGTNAPNNITMPTAVAVSYNASNAILAPAHFNNSGQYANICEIGNIFDPLKWSVNCSNGPTDIPTSATSANNVVGGGNSLRIGRAEHPKFVFTTGAPPNITNGMRASQLLDIFEVGLTNAAMVTNVPAGRININTATTNVLRALAAGVYHTSDPALNPSGTNFVVPTNAVDAFVTGVTNFRSQSPFYAPSQLTLITTNTNLSQWPTNAVFGNKAVAGVTEWSDAACEEWFSKIYPLSTVRSRNFLIYVVGQAVPTNAPTTKVDSDATQVFQVYMEPIRANGMTTNSRPVITRSWSL